MSKFLLIGWDAADWQIIIPLLNAGRMPHLAQLMANGCYGNIKTLDPPLSPILWTSIATGKRAYDHGVLHFLRPDPANQKLMPYRNSDRKVKAIWEILSQSDKWSNVIGWWPGFPTDEINGCMVADAFFEAGRDSTAKHGFVKGLVYPDVHFSQLRSMLVEASDISNDFIKEILPGFEPEKYNFPVLLPALKALLAHMLSVHRVSLWVMQLRPWDFHAVYFETIDKACHRFMQFAPPRRKDVSDVIFNAFNGVIDAVYCWHDKMLGDYMALAGNECSILLVSDHGFVSGKERRTAVPQGFSNAALYHRLQGICVWSGGGFQKGKEIFGMSLLDICPTILHCLGLAVGSDMAGKVITEVFVEKNPVNYIESYDLLPPERKFIVPQENDFSDEIALKQMQDLGYVELQGEFNIAEERIRSEQRYNLASSMIEGDRLEEAFDILTALVSSYPENSKFIIALFNLALKLRRFEIAEGAMELLRSGGYNYYNLNGLEGDLHFYRKDNNKALQYYTDALIINPANHYLLMMKGNCLLRLNNYSDARSCLIKSLSIRDYNGYAYYLLAITSYRLGDLKQCIGYCLEAISNNFSNTALHILLGRAAFQSGEFEVARKAFESVLQIVPGKKLIRRLLISIYKDHLPDSTMYKLHVEQLSKTEEHQIIIVSGLPRSGTSLMMQLLEAAGLPVLIDGIRKPDESNPKGYYEYEKVKRIAYDVSWLNEAKGKVVKVVAPLLQHLPPHFCYKIVYLHRDINEIIASQQKMVEKDRGGHAGKSYNVILAESYRKMENSILSKEWKNGSEVLKLDFSELVNGQQEELEKLEDFLGIELDISKMLSVADPSLYRNKLTRDT